MNTLIFNNNSLSFKEFFNCGIIILCLEKCSLSTFIDKDKTRSNFSDFVFAVKFASSFLKFSAIKDFFKSIQKLRFAGTSLAIHPNCVFLFIFLENQIIANSFDKSFVVCISEDLSELINRSFSCCILCYKVL